MQRRIFLGIIALTGAAFSAGKAWADKLTAGRCGAACSQCEQFANRTCGGCGTGEKAQCIVFKCNSRMKLDSCTQCKAFACAKHKRINPPASAAR